MKRVVNQHDILQVERLAYEIFHNFYYPQMPKDHIDFFIQSYQSKEKIKEQIDANFEYYLFFDNQKPIGYLELGKSKVILSKLYVLEKYRGNKTGLEGVNKAKERAAKDGSNTIELFVNHENLKAINFYKKHGFTLIKQVVHSYANQHSETDLLMRFKPKR